MAEPRFTSRATKKRLARVRNNTHLIYTHTKLTENEILKGFLNNGVSQLTETSLLQLDEHK